MSSDNQNIDAHIVTREAEILGKPPRNSPVDTTAIASEVMAFSNQLRANLLGAAPDDNPDNVPRIMFTFHRFGQLWEKITELAIQLVAPGNRLSKRDQKLAILRTGWLLGAPYEFGEHVKQAKRAGFSSEEIHRIAGKGSSAPEWNEHERAILLAAEELRAGAMICDETWAVLSKDLDEEAIFELITLIGKYTLTAYLQNGFRVRLEKDNPGLSAR